MTAEHPQWCARGHRCALGEHRAEPFTLAVPGAGRIVLTRVQGTDRREHAEVWLRLILPTDERDARTRLVALISHLRALIGPPRIAHPTSKGSVHSG